MQIRSFEISSRELAGAFGGYGTILPLVMGYIVVCGLEPGGLFIMLGAVNIILGLVYRLPMPLEPMKMIAVVAIAESWTPSLVYASGFAMGITWLILVGTKAVTLIRRLVPETVVRGIQISLALLLIGQAVKMLSQGAAAGLVSLFIILVLRNNRYAPAGIVLMIAGIFLAYRQGHLESLAGPSFGLPPLTLFPLREVWQSLILAGFSQIPLTIVNAVIVTCAMIKGYWPEKEISERKLALNHGIINSIAPFFGGMPMCHGAGGLAGKYGLGARTGGANVMEGVMEVFLGLFFAASLAQILLNFPLSILGAMLFAASWELARAAQGPWRLPDLAVIGVTAGFGLFFNMAAGFLAGLIVFHLIFGFGKRFA